MGLFSESYGGGTDLFRNEVNMDNLVEAFLVDEATHTWTDDQIA